MKPLQYILCLIICSQLVNCVQDTHKKTITVAIDMTNEVEHANVGIRGNFPLSWDETTFLKDDDGDGIYEGEFEFHTAINAIEFKFVNQNDQFELNGLDNRILNFSYEPETLSYEAIFNNPDANIKKQ